jgi:hypothetical protein
MIWALGKYTLCNFYIRDSRWSIKTKDSAVRYSRWDLRNSRSFKTKRWDIAEELGLPDQPLGHSDELSGLPDE